VTVTLSWADRPGGYVIERTRTKSKADSVTVLEVAQDGTRQEINRTPEDIVGVNHRVFCGTVLRGQGDPWNFAQASDGQKREILAAVSGADRLTGSYKAARSLMGQLERDADAYRQRAEDAQARADRIDLDALERKVQEWDDNSAQRVKDAEAEVKALEAAEEQAEKDDLTARKREQARQDHELSRPTLDMTPYDDAVAAAMTAYSTASATAMSAEADADRLSSLEPGMDCPTCGQVILPDAPVAERRRAAQNPLLELVLP
jgi:ATPase involved in DNA repair